MKPLNGSVAPDVRDGLLEAIGHTPLVRLRGPSEVSGSEILGKAEFLNPGGSVKDRAALFMIREAERRGRLRKGGMIVEATEGNTGIGLTWVGSALGYRTFRGRGRRRPLREPQGIFYANQWDNPANREAHHQTTGPEIWGQTAGRIDGFVCSIGTGGTLAGVGRYLKERSRDIVVALADPMGSAMYHHFVDGELRVEGSSITEGIGQGRVTRNVEAARVDRAYQIPDDEALHILFALLGEEGLCLGGSSGINVAGAMRLARELGPGHTIVTVLPDGGQRYQSKLFNPVFLRTQSLPTPPWVDDDS